MSTPSERGNDTAIEALKQALTLASLILGLTVTFIKDVIGDHRSLAVGLWMVPLAWACLAVTIWSAWIAIAEVAGHIGKSEIEEYEFKEGRAKGLAIVAQWTFCVGLSCLALFGVLNFRLLLKSDERPAPHISRCTEPEEKIEAPLRLPPPNEEQTPPAGQ